jgi:hypothetical protein
MVTGSAAADGALRDGAGIGVDQDIRPPFKVIAQDLLQFLDFSVAGLQAQVPGQNEVEVHEDMVTGAAGPELVDVDPWILAMPGDNLADLL